MNPSTILSGESTTLSWNVTKATTVIIDQGIGEVTLAGSQLVSPATTTSYTLTAISKAGIDTSTIIITVIPPINIDNDTEEEEYHEQPPINIDNDTEEEEYHEQPPINIDNDTEEEEYHEQPPPLSDPVVSPIEGTTITGVLELVSTYECIGVYASYSGDNNQNNFAFIEYREKDTFTWIPGIAMTPDTRTTVGEGIANKYRNQWRASIFDLSPDTIYEVRVTYEDPDGVIGENPVAEVRTRSEIYPSSGNIIYAEGDIQAFFDAATSGDTIYLREGTYLGGLILSQPGTPNGYITIAAAPGEHVVIDARGNTCGFVVRGSYIRIKDIEILGGDYGIWAGPPRALKWGPNDPQPHDVIIEDCILRDPKNLSSEPSKYVGILLGGTSTGYTTNVRDITIQRCKIYLTDPGGTSSSVATGPGIWMQNANGGHVIRDNEIIYTGTVANDVHGMDCIVSSPNFTVDYTLRDMDIYRNKLQGATDDALSLDGNAANVRVWGNTISRANMGISVCPVLIGPAYIFRNVFINPEIHWIGVNRWVKGGEYSTGHVYFYHNTVVYDNLLVGTTYSNGSGKNSPANYGYCLGTGSGQESRNVFSLNNIIEVNGPVVANSTLGPDMDYDLIYHHFDTDYRTYWAQWGGEKIGNSGMTNAENLTWFQQQTLLLLGTMQEEHGVPGKAIFKDRANGDFRLASGSPGIDKGVLIYGFNDANSPWPYSGTAPDIGAYEYEP